jgi:hypothetical protein
MDSHWRAYQNVTQTLAFRGVSRVLHRGVRALIIVVVTRGRIMTNNASHEPESERSKWRGRVAVLVLVLGGLLLLIPTAAIFLAGGD